MIKRYAVVLLALACVPSAARAADNEFRLDEFLSWRLSPRTAVRLQFGEHSGSTISDVGQLYLQAGVAFKPAPWLTLTPAFRHARHQPWADGSFYENRALLDLDLQAERGYWRPSFRTRVEGIFLEGVSGYVRLRLRPSVRYQLPTRGERHPAVVVNDESFYDFRAGRYNRNRPQFGVSLPVKKHFSVTPYYMLDFKWRPAGWDRDNLWGLNFNADF